jgi:hypothetical protein
MMMCSSPVAFAETTDNAQVSNTQVESAYQRISADPDQIEQIRLTVMPVSRTFSNAEQAAILSPLTAHIAQYKVFYGSIELGVANYRLPATNSGFYSYYFDSDVSLLIISDQRHLKSEFTLENSKLVPFRYSQERTGTGSDYSEQTAFAKTQKFIHTIYKQEALKLPYEEKVFDPLMVQLQFRMDLAANLRPLDYKMVKEKEVDDYQFRVLGKEKVTIESGTYDTVKVEVVRDSSKRQTFFWMAPDLAYLPVRLSHFSKGSKQLDIQLASYQFEQPLPPMTPVLIDGPATKGTASVDELAVETRNEADISELELDDIKQLAAD